MTQEKNAPRNLEKFETYGDAKITKLCISLLRKVQGKGYKKRKYHILIILAITLKCLNDTGKDTMWKRLPVNVGVMETKVIPKT